MRAHLLGWDQAPAVRNEALSTTSAPAPAYLGAGQGRRAMGWQAPSIGPNNAVLGSVAVLRQRSRAAVRTDGYAKGAIERLVSNIVGTGIKPLSKIGDPQLRAEVQDRWLRWTDESDADGQLDFYAQQAHAVHAWLEGGEAFVRLRARRPEDGLSVPLQIQVLEPELCPVEHTTTAANGNRIRAGIEFNGIGKRVAYWMHPSHPGDTTLEPVDVGRLVRVPAEQICHLYDPLRPGQIRGLPILTQALVGLHTLDEFEDATLVRQQISNLMAGFIKSTGGIVEGDIDPTTGLAVQVDGEGLPLLPMQPGLLQAMNPGESIEWSNPPSVPDTYGAFIRQQLMRSAIAVGAPYEILTGDLRDVNDRTARMIVNEFRRRVEQWQIQIAFQLCRPVWQAWWTRAVTADALDVPVSYFVDPAPFLAAEWTPQRWPYLNPVQDVQARRDEIRGGLTSRRQSVSELGGDVEALDREIAADNTRADALGLVFDTDPRKTAQTGAAQTAALAHEEAV